MRNDTIELLVVMESVYINGIPVREEKKRTEMMSATGSVKRAEFYAAQREGIQVSLTSTVNKADYREAIYEYTDDHGTEKKKKPNMAVYDGMEYRILRSYEKKEEVELTLQEVD